MSKPVLRCIMRTLSSQKLMNMLSAALGTDYNLLTSSIVIARNVQQATAPCQWACMHSVEQRSLRCFADPSPPV